MNALQMEKEFWLASDEYDAYRKGAAREGIGRSKELREEVFPLVVLGKLALNNLKRVDNSLMLKANLRNEKTHKTLEFDGQYRWKSYQKLFRGYDTKGYIEITSCLIDGHQTRLGHEYLTKHGICSGDNHYKKENGELVIATDGGAANHDAGIAEVTDIIVSNFKIKLTKKYPENTTLALWLSDDNNPKFNYLADWGYLKKEITSLNKGKFKAVCVIGWHVKEWIIGDSLP